MPACMLLVCWPGTYRRYRGATTVQSISPSLYVLIDNNNNNSSNSNGSSNGGWFCYVLSLPASF